MNRKHVFFLMLSLFSCILWAEDTVVTLTDFGARGEKWKTETVIAGNDFLMVNGEKLSPTQIIAQSGQIKKITEFKKPTLIKPCEAGRFEHILKKGKLIRSETGCLESSRYRELKASFKALAKDFLLE